MVKLRKDLLRRASRDDSGPTLRDYVLAALYVAGGRLSKFRLVKMLQVATSHSDRLRELVRFEPHRFGAWSADIGSMLPWLSEEGVVEESREGLVLRKEGEGRKAAVRIGEDAALLREIHELFRVLSDDELLVFVYSVYGGHENSEKRRLLEDRELRLRTALKLYSKGLVSLTLAARVAGLPTVEFARIAREKLGGLPAAEEIIE